MTKQSGKRRGTAGCFFQEKINNQITILDEEYGGVTENNKNKPNDKYITQLFMGCYYF
ncbi:MAG: hypothetical protein OCD00_08140 [Colwellia sp.]